MKIFLDVGAFRGETAKQALGLNFYDEVHSFEPSLYNVNIMEKDLELKTDKFILHPFGLWDKTNDVLLYHDGTNGASIFEDKGYLESPINKGRGGEISLANFTSASEFLAPFGTEHEIILKLNCEGAECDILDNLLKTGEIHKLSGIGIDFDCLKIFSLKDRRNKTVISLIHNNIPFIDVTAVWVPERVHLLTRAFFKEYHENSNATSPN